MREIAVTPRKKVTKLKVLGRDESKVYPHLWLIADDFSALGQLPTLENCLARREYKISTLLANKAK